MNDRPATVPFTPRSTANCLDLAVMYCGRQLPTFLTLWSCAAVPSCALVYVLTYFYEFDMRLPMLVIYVATTVLGGWLIAAVTPGIFQQLAIAGDEEEADNSAPSSLPAQYLTFAALLLGGGLLALVFGPDSPLAGIREELSLLASVLLSIVLFVRAVLLLWDRSRSEEHTSELQSRRQLVCLQLLETTLPYRSTWPGMKTITRPFPDCPLSI